MINYIIGVDAGGTSTKAIAYLEDMTELTVKESGCGSPAVLGESLIWKNIQKAIDEIINELYKTKYHLTHIQMGISAFSILNNVSKKEEELFHKYQATVSIKSDTEIALYSVLKDKYQNGIVVISGTGVAIYGKYGSQTTLIGGWGHIIRELGSAYACVHDLALNIIDQEENDLPLTLFQENFLTYLNKHHITDLKHLFYNHSKKEIAKMAIYVKDEAIKNNQEAKTLLFNEGRNLALQVIKAVNKLHLNDNYVIGLRGGFVQNQNEDIVDGFITTLKTSHINGDVIIDNDQPIIGAYYLSKLNNKF